MQDEYHPLAGLQSGYDLILVGDPVRDIHGQVSRISKIIDVLLNDGGGLPLAFGAGSGHGWEGWWRWENLKFWVLELGDGKAGARRWRGKKNKGSLPSYR